MLLLYLSFIKVIKLLHCRADFKFQYKSETTAPAVSAGTYK